MSTSARTYARIQRATLKANYQSVCEAVGPNVAVLSVVKADAYGHGAVDVARTLASAGARNFAVACLKEGLELRQAGVDGDILLLSGVQPGGEAEARTQRLTPLINSILQLQAWEREAATAGEALPYHLAINTGMNRLGFDVRSAQELASLIGGAPHLRLEGLSTHLAAAENFTSEHAVEQHRKFRHLADELAAAGIRPKYVHLANSGAIAYRPEMDEAMVRPGIALYGYLCRATGPAPASRIQVKPALEWKTTILAVREVAAGARVGYEGTYQTTRPMRIGVLSIGYADGFSRCLSNRGEVLVRGIRCPVIGLVSMDVSTVDLSEVSAAPGDEVTLIGEGLDADEMAAHCGSVSYEVLCGIGRRVPRIYCD